LVVVGVPVWWITTTVYRAPLPYSNIDDLAGQPNYHAVGVKLILKNSLVFSTDLEKNLKSTKGVKFHISSRSPLREELNIMSAAESIDDLDEKLTAQVPLATGELALYVLSKTDLIAPDENVVVGKNRIIFMNAGVEAKLVASVLKSVVLDPLAKKRADGGRALQELKGIHRKEAMRQIPTEPGYDVTLTLMVPEPHIILPQWDAGKAVSDYLNPLVEQLRDVAHLSVRSQVLYMSGLKVAPKWSSIYHHYALPHEQLPLTINDIEAKLGSYVSTRPALHFIIYVPRENQSPLHIHTASDKPLSTNSFLVPRWGGVLIHNCGKPSANASLPQRVALDSHWIMNVVLSHLHKLLPIPSLIDKEEGVRELLPDFSSELALWKVDGLARARVTSYLNNIRITLQSLCELVGEISNMVISDEVGAWVWGAVDEWGECGTAAREGRLKEATIYCSRSFAQADAAFFHPSMLALLYFPDNQKYAIYVPLFLPVSIPVILSLRMVFKLFKKKPETEKKDEMEKKDD